MCQPALFRQCLVYCLAYSEDSTYGSEFSHLCPVADLPTVAISSPRVAILTERPSGAKKTLTSVCNCTTVSFLVQSTAFLVPLPRGHFSMTHTLVPWRAREDSFLQHFPPSSLQLTFSLLRQQVQDFCRPCTDLFFSNAHQCFVCLYVYAPRACLDSRETREGDGFPRTEATDSCKGPCGCWELNLGPLQEQTML